MFYLKNFQFYGSTGMHLAFYIEITKYVPIGEHHTGYLFGLSCSYIS